MFLFIGLSLITISIVVCVCFIIFKGDSETCTFEIEAKHNEETGEIELAEKLKNVSEPIITIGKMLLEGDERILRTSEDVVLYGKETKWAENGAWISFEGDVKTNTTYSFVDIFEVEVLSYSSNSYIDVNVRGINITPEEYHYLRDIFEKLAEKEELEKELEIKKQDEYSRKVIIDKLKSIKEESKNEV